MPRALLDKLTDLKAAFIREHQKVPTVLCLDLEDELELPQVLITQFSPAKMKEIDEKGVRSALPTLLGMAVEWDAETTSVK